MQKVFLSTKRNFCIGCPVPLYYISSKGPSSYLQAHNKRQPGKGSVNLRPQCIANYPLPHCCFTALVAPFNSLLEAPLPSWSNFIGEGIKDHTHLSCTVFYVSSFRSKIGSTIRSTPSTVVYFFQILEFLKKSSNSFNCLLLHVFLNSYILQIALILQTFMAWAVEFIPYLLKVIIVAMLKITSMPRSTKARHTRMASILKLNSR